MQLINIIVADKPAKSIKMRAEFIIVYVLFIFDGTNS